MYLRTQTTSVNHKIVKLHNIKNVFVWNCAILISLCGEDENMIQQKFVFKHLLKKNDKQSYSSLFTISSINNKNFMHVGLIHMSKVQGKLV